MKQRTTWVEVRRDALEQNYRTVANVAGVPVCAVVKADAYGHGSVQTARVFAECGAAMLAVTRLEDARALRRAKIDTPVLIMAPVPDPGEAVALGCAITVGSAPEIADLPAEAEVHLKIDTGMGRLGVRASEALDAARSVAARATLRSVWTHLADGAGTGAGVQLKLFRTVVDAVRADGITCTFHAANSAALLARDDARFDMVRIGTLLYGQHPIGARSPWTPAETFAWYARVAAVRTLPAGATVGYGSEWRARRTTRVATIPVGYADGFGVDPNARTPGARRALRGLAGTALRRTARSVSFDGTDAPVIGRVSMELVAVDVTEHPHVVPGSIAKLPARRMMVSSAIERIMT